MFTGIITDIGTISEARQEPGGDLTIAIACAYPTGGIVTGESIAVDGCCLTVTGKGFRLQASGFSGHTEPRSPNPEAFFTATLSPETLERTAPRWKEGARVNLERSLCVGERVSGHFVTGHVDGTATLKNVTRAEGSRILTLEAPAALARFIAEKGAVTLDGVSLTVNRAEGVRFDVCVIPHTWEHTTLSERLPGDRINIEVDMMARYAARLLEKSI